MNKLISDILPYQVASITSLQKNIRKSINRIIYAAFNIFDFMNQPPSNHTIPISTALSLTILTTSLPCRDGNGKCKAFMSTIEKRNARIKRT